MAYAAYIEIFEWAAGAQAWSKAALLFYKQGAVRGEGLKQAIQEAIGELQAASDEERCDARALAGLLVYLSLSVDSKYAVTQMQPCLTMDPAAKYQWQIRIDPDAPEQFQMDLFLLDWDDRGLLHAVTTVDWRKMSQQANQG
jgi:hypothetical protein